MRLTNYFPFLATERMTITSCDSPFFEIVIIIIVAIFIY